MPNMEIWPHFMPAYIDYLLNWYNAIVRMVRKYKSKCLGFSCSPLLQSTSFFNFIYVTSFQGERKGVNKYYPPDWTPEQVGLTCFKLLN